MSKPKHVPGIVGISDEMESYVSGQWGLESSEYDDETVMLWCSGYHAEAVWLLVDNGAFSFEPDSAPEAVNREAKHIHKCVKRGQVYAAIGQCADPLTGDYRAIECPECGAIEYLNRLYWDDVGSWPCHSCDSRKGMVFVEQDDTPCCHAHEHGLGRSEPCPEYADNE